MSKKIIIVVSLIIVLLIALCAIRGTSKLDPDSYRSTRLTLPHIDRDRINDDAFRKEAENHLLEKHQTEFDILEQTGNVDEYVIVEYYASPRNNPDIVFKVTFGYSNPAMGLLSLFWYKYTADNLYRGIPDYVVNQFIEKNPISITDKIQMQTLTDDVAEMVDQIKLLLHEYNAGAYFYLVLPLKIQGNDTELTFSGDYYNLDKEEVYQKILKEYNKQLAINSGDPAYDYEFEYAGTDHYYINVVMIDDDNIHIELEGHYDPMILTGYKEYRKSGEFAYLYIKSAQDESGERKEMEDYSFDYNVSGLKEVYVCDGDGRTYLIWSRESDDLTE